MASTNVPSSSSQDATSFLREATFARPDATSASADAVTASDVLLGAYDPARLHPMSGISDTLDYLTLDDEKLNDTVGASTAMPSRGFGDDLCYGTGTMYLSGESSVFRSIRPPLGEPVVPHKHPGSFFLSAPSYCLSICHMLTAFRKRSSSGRGVGPPGRCLPTLGRVQRSAADQQHSQLHHEKRHLYRQLGGRTWLVISRASSFCSRFNT